MEEQESRNGFSENQEPIPVTSQFPSTVPLTDSVVQKSKKHPTIEEVKTYVQEKGYHFDPQQFLDYYEASGWRFKDGRPVKSWKQCCVTWEGNCKASGRKVDAGGDVSQYNYF